MKAFFKKIATKKIYFCLDFWQTISIFFSSSADRPFLIFTDILRPAVSKAKFSDFSNTA